MADDTGEKTPILLLKTKSVPTDAYEKHFSTLDAGRYEPAFVPVLEHRFKQDALDEVRQCVTNRGFVASSRHGSAKYGAIIFTSQRAVEAFTRVINDIRECTSDSLDKLLPATTPFYVVGPATARGLKALNLSCPILGEETGNGEVLSTFILEHYNSLYSNCTKPPILFLVGEKRRDIIPKTLQSNGLSPERRSKVDELVIYETGEMQSFKSEFSSIWKKNVERKLQLQWIVVFSPTGCKAMLESLGLLDRATGKMRPDPGPRNIRIATIGPTTRDYLIDEFGFSPDACAEKPSPEGVGDAINAQTANMVSSTRSSARIAANSSPKQDKNAAAGTKRKADDASSSQSKRGRKATPKKQKAIEETTSGYNEKNVPKQAEMKEAADEGEGEGTKEVNVQREGTSHGTDVKELEKEEDTATKDQDKAANGLNKTDADGEGAVEESSQRVKNKPSNILEQGIIYFFMRNRVGIEEAESVGDLARTYFVLRPLPKGAKLGDGPIQDLRNNRLFALPKKVLPKSHRDRFMAFVEKANTTIQDLKDNFFRGSEYETKTSGTRRTAPVTTVGEGVYAITRTEDRTTHLAYMLTIPSELGEVQKDLGLRAEGYFVMNVKNPERPGPTSARLPQGPGFPKEIIEEFRGLAWTEAKPKYLDYVNCQILLIGENTEKAMEPTIKDQKHNKETPKEEIEQLEHEDELRVEHLHGDDSVFDDLKISKKDYPQVPTTW
ncbi:tetrapyrrole biosynthesis, uroporphyrinogen III synthase [Zopfia rhizophila CBS 207.26]|uniref:Tetrapyrrole biosynthesis, uroporphyrinogen III synthase n=1 Tax=Zopfia rhizophila CBS 207.26 TaxID=1314779 RepID=A0A6A6EZ35_9PEZI|nr:tetrapyrrole biosynthesis, uroporphyrinogen III synthase [Zopfia rhizophila CBS 207.26]